MIVNIARRAHDHNWELDPITRSLLDTDFYKLLMLQFIWKHFPTTRATFSLQNRTTSVRLGEIIELHELRAQLENTRKLRFHKSELIWLAGNTFYGRRGMFEPAFLEWLDKDFQLSASTWRSKTARLLSALMGCGPRRRSGRSIRSQLLMN